MDRVSAVKAIRDAVVSPVEECNEVPVGNTKPKKKVPKFSTKRGKSLPSKGMKKKGAKRVGKSDKKMKPVKMGMREEARAFAAWMEDVNEAVDQFIGMDIDVLPEMPWQKWFKAGMSAVVAAKNAAQMYEDLDDEEEHEFDEEEEEIDEDDIDEGLGELIGLGKLPYHKWFKKIDAILKRSGSSLTKVREEMKIASDVFHSWYMTGYPPDKVAVALLGKRKAFDMMGKGNINSPMVSKGSARRRGLAANIGEWADALGVRESNGTGFMEEEDEPEEEDEVEETPRQDEVVETYNEQFDSKPVLPDKELFGVDITEMAQRSKKMLGAGSKPKEESVEEEIEDEELEEGVEEEDSVRETEE